MSILIKGMEMPEKIEPGLVIEFADGVDGKRYARLHHDLYGSLTDWLEAVPATDVVEVRHGLWINERQEGLSSFSTECSLCGKRTLAYFHYFYCPNCGARMDGGQEK